MIEPALIQRQRELLRALNDNIARQVKMEAAAAAELVSTQDQVEASHDALRSFLSDAQAALKTKRLAKDMEERVLSYSVQPLSGLHSGDPFHELSRCVSTAKDSLDQVHRWKGLGCAGHGCLFLAIFGVVSLPMSIVGAVLFSYTREYSPLFVTLLCGFALSGLILLVIAVPKYDSIRLKSLEDSYSALAQAVANGENWCERSLSEAKLRYTQAVRRSQIISNPMMWCGKIVS